MVIITVLPLNFNFIYESQVFHTLVSYSHLSNAHNPHMDPFHCPTVYKMNHHSRRCLIFVRLLRLLNSKYLFTHSMKHKDIIHPSTVAYVSSFYSVIHGWLNRSNEVLDISRPRNQFPACLHKSTYLIL